MAETVTRMEGVNLTTVFNCLRKILYGSSTDATEDAAIVAKATKYIIPMNHNWLNPMTPQADDTFVEYIVEEDMPLVKDSPAYNAVTIPVKKATILLRFIGVQAEERAKMFHMLSTRQSVASVFFTECYARSLDYVSAIHCHSIDYYGKNGALAWDMRLTLSYTEVYHLDQQALESVTLAAGSVN